MEKYTYIRKTITWQNRRYEVRGKTEQEACDKLAELITSLKNTPYAAAGSTTVDQWFVQWRDTYKAPSGLMIQHDCPLSMPVLAFVNTGSFSALNRYQAGSGNAISFDSPSSPCYHIANKRKEALCYGLV